MPGYVRANGLWVPTKGVSLRDAGAWKTVKEAYVMDGGVWKRYFRSRPNLAIFPQSFQNPVYVSERSSYSWANVALGAPFAQRLLLIGLTMYRSSNYSSTPSLTVNGTAATYLGGTSGNRCFAGWFLLPEATLSTATVAVSTGVSTMRGFSLTVHAVAGFEGATPKAQVFTAITANASTNISVADEAIAVGNVCYYQGTADAAWNGLTKYSYGDSTFRHSTGIRWQATPGNFDVGMTTGGTNYFAHCYLKLERPEPYRYVRWNITANRGNADTQMSEFAVYNPLGQNIVAGITPYWVDGPGSSPSGEGPEKVTDNLTTTKFNRVGSNGVIDMAFDLGSRQYIHSYAWITANDQAARDPFRWTFQVSNDATNWSVVHTIDGTVTQATRQAVVGPWTI